MKPQIDPSTEPRLSIVEIGPIHEEPEEREVILFQNATTTVSTLLDPADITSAEANPDGLNAEIIEYTQPQAIPKLSSSDPFETAKLPVPSISYLGTPIDLRGVRKATTIQLENPDNTNPVPPDTENNVIQLAPKTARTRAAGFERQVHAKQPSSEQWAA